jgi:precorrin-6B methylase 2
VAAAVDLTGVGRVVDVGGGRGGLVSALLAANPQVQAVVFDLPGVVENAAERLAAAGVAERSEVVAGDFRQAVPPGADAYVLSWVLHDWDDETALLILHTCRAAMAPGARLLVVEMVVPEPGQPGADLFARTLRQTDLEMLVVVGGRERTRAEYAALFSAEGFTLTRVVPLSGLPWSVIEGAAV